MNKQIKCDVNASLRYCPPSSMTEYDNGIIHKARKIIPLDRILVNLDNQPRETDKGNNAQDLMESFLNHGWKPECQPMIVREIPKHPTYDYELVGGFTRHEVLKLMFVSKYIFDIVDGSDYAMESLKARSNPTALPSTAMTDGDYISHTKTVIDKGLLDSTDQKQMSVWVKDMTPNMSQRKRDNILNKIKNSPEINPNVKVQTYTALEANDYLENVLRRNSQGDSKKNLTPFSLDYVKSSSSAPKNVFWDGWNKYFKYDCNYPVNVFGYINQPTDVGLYNQRVDYLKNFENAQQTFFKMVSHMTGIDTKTIDSERYPIKFVGFLPQRLKDGKLTEGKLVDVNGKTISTS